MCLFVYVSGLRCSNVIPSSEVPEEFKRYLGSEEVPTLGRLTPKLYLNKIGAIRGTRYSIFQSFQMSALKSLIKLHNERSGPSVTPLRLAFEEEGGPKNEECKKKTADKGKVVIDVDDDLQKPFKEVSRSPFTRRIIEFSAPKHLMPTNLKLYDGSTDPDDHITRFAGAAN
ncbi:hypothetical protein Tco_1301110 [Tanacetum coccineum]